jgi:hypothetical protein
VLVFPIGFLSGLTVLEIRLGKHVQLIVSSADWLDGQESQICIEGPCMLTDPDGTEHRVELSTPDSISSLLRLRSRVISTAFVENGGALQLVLDDGSVFGSQPDAEGVMWTVDGPGGYDGTRVIGGPGREVGVRHPWFELALAQTIAWCAPRADANDPAGSLRSTLLRPKMLGANGRLEISSIVDVRSYSDPAMKAATEVQSSVDLQGGRLLVYFPEEELADGAAEAETAGFFDVFDAPPWDTWVAMLGSAKDRVEYNERRSYSTGPYLVSWVPPAFLDLAAAGIAVNPVACIRWLEDTDIPLRARLRERGVLA